MSRSEPGLSIELPAEASQVVLVRHALTGLAQSIGMDEEAIADVQTVVTEACMNAVLHAYPDGNGRVRVEATAEAGELVIRVIDRGCGIRAGADDPRGDGASLRLGLTLIAALSVGYELAGGAGRGTTVTMRMPIKSATGEPGRAGGGGDSTGEDGVRLQVIDGAVLPHVLSRTITAFAATGDLSVDRLSDSMLLGDALAGAAAGTFLNDLPCFELAIVDGGLELLVGPLADGGAERLHSALEVPGGHGSMERLVDEVRTEEREDGPVVVFRLAMSTTA